jgi:hypothetical protein
VEVKEGLKNERACGGAGNASEGENYRCSCEENLEGEMLREQDELRNEQSGREGCRNEFFRNPEAEVWNEPSRDAEGKWRGKRRTNLLFGERRDRPKSTIAHHVSARLARKQKQQNHIDPAV